MSNKVRVGKVYKFTPVLWDQFNCDEYTLEQAGNPVRVVNKYGCPKANTMGMCYIESLEGEFIGMVCTNSLE